MLPNSIPFNLPSTTQMQSHLAAVAQALKRQHVKERLKFVNN